MSLNRTALDEIRAEMARQQLAQGDLAALLGWTQPRVSRRLSGRVPLTLDDLAAIVTALSARAGRALPLGQFLQPRNGGETNHDQAAGEDTTPPAAQINPPGLAGR